jgi:WD40 repeat protein
MKHGGPVNSAEFGRDGQRVVTASQDNTARLWNATSGKAIGEPMWHEGAVLSARFSPDGERVITASNNNTVRLWDAASGQTIGETMGINGMVNSTQFSPDGQRVMTASSDSTVRLWDTPTIRNQDTPDDVLLLADLAEATGVLALQAYGQTDFLAALTPDQVKATRAKIAVKFLGPSSKLTPLRDS